MEEMKDKTLKKGYYSPSVDAYYFDKTKDILCMSNESNDNDFGAGDLGGFTDGN